ncbi:MAG: Ig-like domain-containing protein, partial [Candidatus Cloacimonadales bacterium]
MKKRKMISFLVFTFVLIFSATNLLARPILDQSFEPQLNTILEDAAEISGDNIEAIIVEGSIEDPLGSTNSIAVTAVDNSNGVWQYSLDNGNNWQNFSAETESFISFPENAVLLSGTATNEFTNKIRFLPKAGYPDQNADLPNIDGNATFEFVAWNEIDGSAGDSADTTDPDSEIFSLESDFASITVSAVNDDPVFYQNQIEITDNFDFPEAIYEGVTHNLDSANFSVSDPDIGGNQLIIEFNAENGIINFPTAEEERFISGNNSNNVTLVTNISLMNQLLNNFTYTADSQFFGTETISVRLNDQGKSGIGGGEDVIRNILVEVMLRNHAPVLNSAIDHNLEAIMEDDFDSAGTLVGDILTPESITDINLEEAHQAIAIIGVDNSNGIWQYSIDGGSSFQNITSVTDSYVDLVSSSLLLNGELENAAATLLRFVPAADYFGTANLRFRAWDMSQYSSGQFVDTSENGGNTAFSEEYDSAAIEVINVNDAPELWVEGNLIDDEVTITVPLSDPFVYNFSSVDAIEVSDIDAGSSQMVVNILSSKGTVDFPRSGRFVSNNGTDNVTLAGRLATINDYLDNFIYTANPGEEGYETFELIINDLDTRAEITRYITFQISNIPPVFTSTPLENATEDEVYNYNLTAEDEDGSELTFDFITLPDWLNLTDNGDGTALLSGTPLNQHVGINNVELIVYDPFTVDSPISQTFTIDVANVNDAPIFVSEPITEIEQDAEYNYQIITDDIDPTDDALTITAGALPAWLTLTDNGDRTATLIGTPQNEDVGIYDITLQVSDGIAAPATEQSFQIEVININDAPQVVNPLLDFSFDEDTSDNSINLSSVFSDIDLIYGDELV